MHVKLAAMTFTALVGMLHTGQAAPIQVLWYNHSGQVSVGGLTGEIYISLRGPDERLNRQAALSIPNTVKDNFVPGEITYLGLSGINGLVSMGSVIKPGFFDYTDLSFVYQVGFDTPPIELTPDADHIVSTPPPGIEGFWIIVVPEPTSIALAGFSLLGLAARRRMMAPVRR